MKTHGRHSVQALRRRDLPLPAHRPRRRAQDGDGARHHGRRVALRRRRPARQLLRAGAGRQAERHLGRLHVRRQVRQKAAQEPADIQLQFARRVQGQVRQVLRRVPREGHGAQKGAQGRRPQEARRDLRHHDRPRPLRGAARRT